MDDSGASEGRDSPSKCVPCSRAETLVEEVAFDVSRGLQHHLQRADRADETATDHDLLRNDVTFNLRSLPKYKSDAMDVALNLAIEVKLALRCHVAVDNEVFANC